MNFPFTLHNNNDTLLSEQGKELLQKYYKNGNNSIQEVIARPANNFSYGDNELAEFIYNAASKQWFFYSSPVLSNAIPGEWDNTVDYYDKEFWKHSNIEMRKRAWLGENPKTMNISCFGTYIDDTIDSQIKAGNELAYLSIGGGGTSACIKTRAVSNKAPGIMPYMRVIDSLMGYYTQSTTRKGACAVYLDISHPDIVEFIKIRTPSGGDITRKILNRAGFHHGVNITHDFKNAIVNDLDFDLFCPHSKEIKQTIKARELWELILDTRTLTGEPYLFFKDVANEKLPQHQKDLGLAIHNSNLCCLTGDTIVTIKESTLGEGNIMIKELNVLFNNHNLNYEIKSYDEINKCIVWKPIKKVWLTKHTPRIQFTNTTNKQTSGTFDHKHYTKNRGWVEANSLQLNDELLNENLESELFVNKAIKILEDNAVPVYDITVEDTHCFFANGLLVHNCEIMLPSSPERSFVCCLSSINLEKYEEWKDTPLVAMLTKFLDNVLQWYIDYAPDHVERTKFSAMRERAIGIGQMGWHNFLMSKGIPFESGGFNSAIQWNNILSKHINDKSLEATIELAQERGICPDFEPTVEVKLLPGNIITIKGNNIIDITRNNESKKIFAFQLNINDMVNTIGLSNCYGTFIEKVENVKLSHNDLIRNSHRQAIAPNANSGALCNTTPSIEPMHSNAYTSKTRAGTFLVKNKYLIPYLEKYNINTSETWKTIIKNDGSILHINELSDYEKSIFKTAFEIDQHWIIEHAITRQPYICQGQSLNVFFMPGSDKAYINSVHLKAMKSGIVKGMYYFRTGAEINADSIKDVKRISLKDWKETEDNTECVACSG